MNKDARIRAVLYRSPFDIGYDIENEATNNPVPCSLEIGFRSSKGLDLERKDRESHGEYNRSHFMPAVFLLSAPDDDERASVGKKV